jgi:sugar phosphate isomerase/epimerase
MTTNATLDRRRFLALAAAAGTAGLLRGNGANFAASDLQPFQISLAQWSLHRTLFAKQLDPLDFPKATKAFGIDAVEYVNSFYKDKATDTKYLDTLRQRCKDEGVLSLLIMCDGEGALGDPDEKKRKQAVLNHHQWVDAAARLGCHSIRVNAQSSGSREEQVKLAADGLRNLCEYSDKAGIHVIVENHGGLSSDGKWLSEVLRAVAHPRCGALPDFGNFRISKDETYDRYLGVDELMPFAKGVSAKSHDFDAEGNEIHTDYRKMLDIVVVKHGYRGHIGIEYEGGKISEEDGIRRTLALLQKLRGELVANLQRRAQEAQAEQERRKREQGR